MTDSHASRPPLPDPPRGRELRLGAIFADIAGQVRARPFSLAAIVMLGGLLGYLVDLALNLGGLRPMPSMDAAYGGWVVGAHPMMLVLPRLLQMIVGALITVLAIAASLSPGPGRPDPAALLGRAGRTPAVFLIRLLGAAPMAVVSFWYLISVQTGATPPIFALLALIGTLLGSVLQGLLAPAVAAAVIERRGALDSLGRTLDLTRGVRWPVSLLYIGALIAVAVPQAIITYGFPQLTFTAGRVVGPASIVLLALLSAALYRDLLAPDAANDPAAVFD